MNFKLAIKVFLKVLRDGSFARNLEQWLDKPALAAPATVADAPARTRTDAIELLATLQREGRLIDFLQEDIATYSDAQIGAAVRDIHRDCQLTIDRLFGLEPLRSESENSVIELPADKDPGLWKLTGQVDSHASKGTLCHHGWKITRHELPAWQGRDTSVWVIAPAEVELA
jgi:hypothetical protein